MFTTPRPLLETGEFAARSFKEGLFYIKSLWCIVYLKFSITLPPEMFGAFGSVWCNMALGESGVSLHDDAMPFSFSSRLMKTFFKSHNFFIMEK